ANRRLRKSLRLGFISGTGGALVAALGAPWLLGYFTQDAEILRQGTILLWLTVLLEPGRAFNLVVINALRAAGDARYPLRVGVGSMLVVLAGGSWLFGHVLGWGLPGVWLAYILDEWLRGLLMWRRWARLDWLPMAKASRRRVARI
ncbi:MAG: MATE family efflux transporter, partial [bacterium]